MFYNLNKNINYFNFGYNPSGFLKQDLYGKLFGHRNLIKRLQAKDIISALAVKQSELVLDLGCGAGYFAVELAKLGKSTLGIDINSYIRHIKIPSVFGERLKFVQSSGTDLPFREGFFDKILASEVLPMIAAPELLLREIRRVLKDEGKLVISNGTGHPTIEKAFAEKSFLFRFLQKRYADKMPDSYKDYCEALQKSFGTARNSFISEEEIKTMLEDNGFFLSSLKYTPGYMAGAYISWTQFINYLRRGQTLSQKGFVLKYHFFNLLGRFERRTYPGGILCVAHKIG